jgi:transposase-like protein
VSRPKQPHRRELWRQRIAQQEATGQSIRAFCRDQKLSEHSFYAWRKQLETTTDTHQAKPIRFALVETTKPANRHQAEPLELILAGGDRLRIPADEGILRLVLSVLQSKPA